MMRTFFHLVMIGLLLTFPVSSYAETFSDLVQQGDAYLVRKDYRGAERVYSKALKVNDKNSEAHRGLGDALSRSTRNRKANEKAREHYKKAIELDPTNIKARHGLTSCHIQLREFDKAIEQAKIILETDPKSTEAQYRIAVAYNHVADENYFGDEEQVNRMMNAYLRVIEMDPDHEGAVNNVAVEYIRKGSYDEALSILMRFLERHPENVSLLLTAAKTFRLKQEYERTEEYCSRALSVDPKNREAKEVIDLAQKGNAERQKIISMTNEILRDLLKTGSPLERDAAERLIAGKSKEVVATMNGRIEKNKEDGTAYFLLAMASFLEGDTEGARMNSASANGYKYQNKYLEEYRKLTSQYDSNLSPFIR